MVLEAEVMDEVLFLLIFVNLGEAMEDREKVLYIGTTHTRFKNSMVLLYQKWEYTQPRNE